MDSMDVGLTPPTDAEVRAGLRRLVEALERAWGERLVTVALYGSRAAGTARPMSDIDVLVVSDALPTRRWDRTGVLYEIAEAAVPRLRPFLSTKGLRVDEARRVKPFYLGMLDACELLLDRDGFFAGVLDDLRRRLEARGARRMTTPDGHVWWDLCPNWPKDWPVVL